MKIRYCVRLYEPLWFFGRDDEPGDDGVALWYDSYDNVLGGNNEWSDNEKANIEQNILRRLGIK